MPDVENWPDAPVPDPSDAPSYDGLNEQLLAQRAEQDRKDREVLGLIAEDVKRAKVARIINDHAPQQYNRYLPNVRCATPACNFDGVFYDHAVHVTDLIFRELKR